MMFRRILIANRGEIACRIMRTAQALGVETVAVYSDADADALHVGMADFAVRIGPAPVADSYLQADRIIAAALETGAEAIHPGYGFLSENPAFVEAVTAAGLTFIGPSAKAIRAMGLKDAAKALMEKAGVPVVPGYQGEEQDAAYLAKEAKKIGYPVLIKAVAGGGGKGMRLVESADDFAAHLQSAKAEARTAFGNDRVLIEKFVQSPRHIEVQVFGDGQDAVHLFERDCSLQRRHQKVIEEAPAPGMTPHMRSAMGAAAVKAARAIGYAGAGTVEFIVDGADGLHPDKFWFMEMNTRLQVEHPVTEAITGVDLVAWQLRVAAGEALPAAQDELHIQGHAFEARLCAEDVPAGFLPATGRIAHLAFPSHARIDTGVGAGTEVSPWYDPMIAKVTVHGPDRASALAQLQRALQETEVAGLVTNLAFLQKLAAHPDFATGDVDTGLIAAHPELTMAEEASSWRVAWAAVIAADQQESFPHQGFALWEPLCQRVVLDRSGDTYEATLRWQDASCLQVEVAGSTHRFERRGEAWWHMGQRCPAGCRHGDAVTLFGPQPITFGLPNPLIRETGEHGGDVVLAPMPGLVQAVSVKPGEQVTSGQAMVVLEAMKMEHILRAPRDGTVSDVTVKAGGQVTAGETLVSLEAET